MSKRIALFFVCLFTMIGMAMAQSRVTGTVTSSDDGLPVVGASVMVKGTTLGTITDLDGNFILTNVPSSAKTLVVSFVGMKTSEVAIKAKVNVVLDSDAQALDEVVVTAYGTSTKGSFTGSASVMKADKLEKRQVSNVSQALAGAVAGVQVLSSNGQPGVSATVRVRGVGSINAGASPLYVVDGVPFDGDLSSINSADIESMTVLKDAASTALYGARGANGIIMITTKKGSQGKAVVNFDAKWGSNSRGIKNYNVLRSPKEYIEKEYTAIYNSAAINLGYDAVDAHLYANQNLTTNKAGGSGYQVFTVPAGEMMVGMNGRLNPNAMLGYNDGTHYYTPDNWEKEMFNPSLRQEYNMSVSGSSDRNSFFLSYGYLSDGGLISGSGFRRSSARFKDEYKVNNWMKVGANVNYIYSKSRYPGDQTSSSSSGNAFGVANQIAPIYPIYVRDAKGNIMTNQGRLVYDYGTVSDAGRDRSFMSISNPAGQLIYDKDVYSMDILNTTWYAELTPLKGLTLTARYGVNVDNTTEDVLQNAYMGQFAASEGGAYQYATRTYGFDQQYVANYQFRLGEQNAFDLTAGYDGYQWKERRLYGGVQKLYNPESFWISNGVSQKNNSGSQKTYVTKGYFARVNYSYDDKYIGNVSYRRDASSRFAKGHRWGDFWSASVAWLMSKEAFMENVSWVDMLKFKASFGQQGNDNVNNYYAWTDQYDMTGDASGFSDGTLSYKGNKDLTWETSTSYNVGFDFALLNSRLNGTIEYFGRKSSDMLYYKPVAGSLGYTQIPMNVGSMTNSGLEIDLNYDIIRTKNISLNVNANATFSKNTINELHPDLGGQLIDGSRIYEEGQSMYRMLLPEWAGVDVETGAPMWYFTNESGAREKTFDYSVAQQTDNRIATDDLLADVYGGFGATLTAFGFDASVQLSYQLGGQIYDNGYAALMHSGYVSYAGTNWHTDIRKAWTPENRNTDVPRLNASDRYTRSTSTRFLTSSDYLSLNNVTIGYTIPAKVVRKLGLSKLRLYVSGDNLALLSARKGLDPRQSFTAASVSTYTAIRSLSGGVSLSF